MVESSSRLRRNDHKRMPTPPHSASPPTLSLTSQPPKKMTKAFLLSTFTCTPLLWDLQREKEAYTQLPQDCIPSAHFSFPSQSISPMNSPSHPIPCIPSSLHLSKKKNPKRRKRSNTAKELFPMEICKHFCNCFLIASTDIILNQRRLVPLKTSCVFKFVRILKERSFEMRA